MNQTEAVDFLVADGWREYPDQFKKEARMFCKTFDTPTRCHCNDDKPGIQVCIWVWPPMMGMDCILEMEVSGGLPDETWVRLHNHSLPSDIEATVALIPRLLATWEAVATFPLNQTPSNQP